MLNVLTIEHQLPARVYCDISAVRQQIVPTFSVTLLTVKPNFPLVGAGVGAGLTK